VSVFLDQPSLLTTRTVNWTCIVMDNKDLYDFARFDWFKCGFMCERDW